MTERQKEWLLKIGRGEILYNSVSPFNTEFIQLFREGYADSLNLGNFQPTFILTDKGYEALKMEIKASQNEA